MKKFKQVDFFFCKDSRIFFMYLKDSYGGFVYGLSLTKTGKKSKRKFNIQKYTIINYEKI